MTGKTCHYFHYDFKQLVSNLVHTAPLKFMTEVWLCNLRWENVYVSSSNINLKTWKKITEGNNDSKMQTNGFHKSTRNPHLIFFDLILGRMLPLTFSAQFLQVSLWFVQEVLLKFVFWLVSFESGLEGDCNITASMRSPCLHRWRNGKCCLTDEEKKHAILTFMYLISISVFFSNSVMSSLWNFLNCRNKVNEDKSAQNDKNQ